LNASEAAEAKPDSVSKLRPPRDERIEDRAAAAEGTGSGAGRVMNPEGIGTGTIKGWPVYVDRTRVVVTAGRGHNVRDCCLLHTCTWLTRNCHSNSDVRQSAGDNSESSDDS
jgi:hypothetical protein